MRSSYANYCGEWALRSVFVAPLLLRQPGVEGSQPRHPLPAGMGRPIRPPPGPATVKSRLNSRFIRFAPTKRSICRLRGVVGNGTMMMVKEDEARMWARSVLRGQALEISESVFEETRGRVLRMMQQGDANAEATRPATAAARKPRVAVVSAPSSSSAPPRGSPSPGTVSTEPGSQKLQRLKQSRAAIASAASALQRERLDQPSESQPRTSGAADQRTRPNAEQLAAAVKAVRAEVSSRVDINPPNLSVALRRSEVTMAHCSALSSPSADPCRMTEAQRRGRAFYSWRCTTAWITRQRTEHCIHAKTLLCKRVLTVHFWHWRLEAKAAPPASAFAPAPKRGPSIQAVQRMLYRWDRRSLACTLRRWRQRTVLVCVIKTEAQIIGSRVGSARLGSVATHAHHRSMLRISMQQWKQRTARKIKARHEVRLRKQEKEIAELRTRLATSRRLAVRSPPAHVR